MFSVLIRPVGSDSVELYNSNMPVASSSQVLPRVEAGDVLTSWEQLCKWKQRTTRLIPFYGGMSVEGVISPDYEDQPLMMVSASMSRPVLKEVLAFGSLLSKLWTWLNKWYAQHTSKLIAVQYSNLMAIKISSSESVKEYILRVDDSPSALEAAAFKVDADVVVHHVIGGLHTHLWPMAALMLFAGTIKTVDILRDALTSCVMGLRR